MNDTVTTLGRSDHREVVTGNGCPVDTCVEVIGSKWKPTILYHLSFGSARFNVLRRLIPNITARMLTLQLRELEADGVVSRTVAAQVPPRVDYDLTEEGHTLLPILSAMAAWGARRQPERHPFPALVPGSRSPGPCVRVGAESQTSA